MTLHSIVLIVAISLFTVPGVAAQGYSSSTTENYDKTYSFFGGSDCYKTRYISSGETFRINAWESSYGSSYGSSCNLYFQTSDSSAKDPVFKFKFDSNKRNYIDESSVSLEIYDTSSTTGYQEDSYSKYSILPSYRQSVYSRYFTLRLEKDVLVDATYFDFSIIVSVDYDTYTYSTSTYFRWYWVALPLFGISIFCSILACAIRSCRYRQLARERAANGNVAMVNTSSVNNPSAYSTVSQPNTAAPPSYPAQPYPTGNQAYPTQPQPYPNPPQPYPTQPQPYPTQPQPYPTQPQPYPDHLHSDPNQAPPTYEEIVTSNPPSK